MKIIFEIDNQFFIIDKEQFNGNCTGWFYCHSKFWNYATHRGENGFIVRGASQETMREIYLMHSEISRILSKVEEDVLVISREEYEKLCKFFSERIRVIISGINGLRISRDEITKLLDKYIGCGYIR